MTAAAYQRQRNPTMRPEPPVKHRRRGLHVYLMALAFVACEMAGLTAVVRAYEIAQTTLTSTSEFGWFWAGMCLVELPLVWVMARRETSPSTRTALLIFYGLTSFLPKLLRNPGAPAYHDEYAHWRSTYEILSTGKLFQPNPIIRIISEYPGLHAATATIVQFTGFTIWRAATVLLILLHVALVLGVAALARSLGLDNRTASLVAVLYCLNSSFLYFDTQYAYESMAITLAVWTLVAYVRAIRSPDGNGRAAWAVLTVMLSAGTVITHHLSTLMLLAIMALISLAVSVPWLARMDGWGRTAATAWGLTVIAALIAGAWFHFVAPTTLSYLSPYLGEGISQLLQVANGSGAGRQLFGASLSPWWEQKSAYIVTILALGMAIAGLLLIRAQIRNGSLPRGRRRAIVCAFAILGLLYFPSTLFILSASGAEGARRSWAFTWFGLSILAGPAAAWLVDWCRHHASEWWRLCLYSGLMAALAVALIGGTAAGLQASYRFPGPFLYGSDARSVTPELLAASEWFSARFGVNNNIVTDRYTGLVFASFGLQNTASPSAGFPTYDLYLAKAGARLGPSYLLDDLSISDYTYLIVDQHMAYELPELGIYFVPSEPGSLFRAPGNVPVFRGRLQKFNAVNWMVKVYQSDNYSIYRLDLPVSRVGYEHRPPRSSVKLGKQGKLLRGKLSVTS